MLTRGHKFHGIIVLGKLYEPRERTKLTQFYLIRKDFLEEKIFANEEQKLAQKREEKGDSQDKDRIGINRSY